MLALTKPVANLKPRMSPHRKHDPAPLSDHRPGVRTFCFPYIEIEKEKEKEIENKKETEKEKEKEGNLEFPKLERVFLIFPIISVDFPGTSLLFCGFF